MLLHPFVQDLRTQAYKLANTPETHKPSASLWTIACVMVLSFTPVKVPGERH